MSIATEQKVEQLLERVRKLEEEVAALKAKAEKSNEPRPTKR